MTKKKRYNKYDIGGDLLALNNMAAPQQYNNTNASVDIRNAGVSGAMSGISTGAKIGSFIPGVGNVIGGAIGGIFGGLMGGQKATQAEENNKFQAQQAINLFNKQKLEKTTNLVNQGNNEFIDSATQGLFAYGGNMYSEGGSIGFNNGVTQFNTGGTHEQNPNDGIPQGIGQNGQPNKVEEGEVKYNNYIYSNRLTADEKLLKQVGLPTTYKGSTFGEIAKKLSEESKERPNDPISKTGLDNTMSRLKEAQDAIKAKQAAKHMKALEKLGIAPQQMQQPIQQGQPMEQENTQEQQFDKGGNLFVKGGTQTIGAKWDDKLVMEGSDLTSTTSGKPGYKDILSTESIVPLTAPAPTAVDSTTTDTPSKLRNNWEEPLRYAPILGSLIGLGLNKKDYTNADAIGNLAAPTNLKTERIGDKMAYNPLDRNYYLNILGQNNAAARSAAANASGGNRANYMANVLAADYNYNQGAGNLARQAEEFNLNQRHQVADFNRGTNQFNAQQGNVELDLNNRNLLANNQNKNIAAQMRESIDTGYNAARDRGIGDIFSTLQGIGQEAYSRNQIDSNEALDYKTTRSGVSTYDVDKYMKQYKVDRETAMKKMGLKK